MPKGEHRPEPVGERTKFQVQVVFTKVLIKQNKEDTYMHIMKDTKDRKIIWFAKADQLYQERMLESMLWYVIECKIGKRDVYRHERNTIVKWVKVLEGPYEQQQTDARHFEGKVNIPLECATCGERDKAMCTKYEDTVDWAIHRCLGSLPDKPGESQEDLYK